jgi:adenine phosphoribosyltransferase
MNPAALAAFLKSRVRTVRDWPKPQVNFRDVTTLFGDPEAFRAAVQALAVAARSTGADRIAAVDARGFILGGALAYELDRPFVLVRKRANFRTAPSRPTTRSSTAPPRSKSTLMPARPGIVS